MKLLVQKTASANTKIIYREAPDETADNSCEAAENSVSNVDENVIAQKIANNADETSKQVVRQIDEENPKLRALDEAIIQGDSTMGSL